MKQTVLNTTLNEILHLIIPECHSEVALQYLPSPSCQTQTRSKRVITKTTQWMVLVDVKISIPFSEWQKSQWPNYDLHN
jgi:hypothetical protein